MTDPLEPFTVRLTVAGYGGIALAMPVLLWQLWLQFEQRALLHLQSSVRRRSPLVEGRTPVRMLVREAVQTATWQ